MIKEKVIFELGLREQVKSCEQSDIEKWGIDQRKGTAKARESMVYSGNRAVCPCFNAVWKNKGDMGLEAGIHIETKILLSVSLCGNTLVFFIYLES